MRQRGLMVELRNCNTYFPPFALQVKRKNSQKASFSLARFVGVDLEPLPKVLSSYSPLPLVGEGQGEGSIRKNFWQSR
jgi:hypothetical protein